MSQVRTRNTRDNLVSKKIILLVNLKSRQSVHLYDRIISQLALAHISPDKIFTIRSGNKISTVMKRIMDSKPELLIVAGGDGTISDIVDHLAGTKIELGVIPLGTTNNFARSLGVPLNTTEAIHVIAHKEARRVDLGNVNGDLFSNIAGVGLSAEIAENISDGLKKRFGRLAYGLTGLRLLFQHKPFHVTISSAHDNLRLNLKTHQLIIANGRYHAGKVIARDAKANNRELVIFKLGGTSRLSLLWHLVDFYIGKRKAVAHTSYLVAKNIVLTTDREVAIELDGESKEKTPAKISIVTAAILIRH